MRKCHLLAVDRRDGSANASLLEVERQVKLEFDTARESVIIVDDASVSCRRMALA